MEENGSSYIKLYTALVGIHFGDCEEYIFEYIKHCEEGIWRIEGFKMMNTYLTSQNSVLSQYPHKVMNVEEILTSSLLK